MSDRADDLLISVSTDLTTIKRQLKQLGQDIGQTTSGIQKQFDGLGKGIDQSLSPVQKRINDMMGIANAGAKPLKEWKGALADTANGVEDIGRRALLSRTGMMELQASGVNAFQALAAGMGPLRVAQMEGAQVIGALVQGTQGGLNGISTAAIGLVTRFPLVTAAIAAATVAFIAYDAVGGTNIRDLDEIIKSHEENIKRLGDAYDEVAGKQKKYAADTAGTVNALNRGIQKELSNKLSGQVKVIFDDLYKSIGSGGGGQGALQTVLKSQFEPFRAAIEKLAEGARNGAPDVKAFRDEVTAIAAVNPKGLDSASAALLALSSAASDTAAAMPSVDASVSSATDTVNEFNLALANVDSKPVQKELQDLFDKARDGKASLDDIHDSLAVLEQANPEFSGIIAGIGKIIIAARNASDALNSVYAGSGNGNGRHESPQRVPDGVVVPIPEFPNKEDLGHASDKAEEAAARRAAAALARANRAPKKTADDRFAEDIQSIRDRTAALTEEYNSLGLSFEAQQKRKVSLDLEQTALKQVREEARKKGDADWQNAQLTPDQIAKIDAVSEAYARQADELRKAQEMYDLQKDVLKGAFDDLRSALDDGKLDWQDFGKIAEDVLDKIIDKIENDLVDAILQASSTGGGGSSGFLGSILGAVTGGGSSDPGIIGALGLRANGGPVTAGKPYIVGEKRPELFVPNTSGTIVPRVPSISAAGSGSNVAVSFAPQITVQGGQGDAGQQVTAALKAYQKDFTNNVVKAIRDAKTRGLT
ncbi:hypothetical protein [Mesorhizobium sp. B2-5-7]|uniref:hypothetical protein n=1 Tax=Mesorhizobium sp. B2-5-7 TaxID=2589923 RepID=UPI00112A2872|nr:hypothetical protein [Mesorhizobium sp. B2-5-7]TPK18056.1 hypothetical protein FJ543_06105 [Mesorhizobium sp. B2-5-7]